MEHKTSHLVEFKNNINAEGKINYKYEACASDWQNYTNGCSEVYATNQNYVNHQPEMTSYASGCTPYSSPQVSSLHQNNIPDQCNSFMGQNDVFYPDEIFQLDQPLKYNNNQNEMLTSHQTTAPTLLDMESGAIHKNCSTTHPTNTFYTNTIWSDSDSYKCESSDDTVSLTSASSLTDDFYSTTSHIATSSSSSLSTSSSPSSLSYSNNNNLQDFKFFDQCMTMAECDKTQSQYYYTVNYNNSEPTNYYTENTNHYNYGINVTNIDEPSCAHQMSQFASINY